MDEKECRHDLRSEFFLKSLLSSGEDLLASLIGFSDIRLIFKKHPIPRSQEGSGGLRPY